MIYFPFKPIKGQAFTLYFSVDDFDSLEPPANGTLTYTGISKDGGTFDATTNTATQIAVDTLDGDSGFATRSRYLIILTTTEMDADVVIFNIFDNGGGICQPIAIYTTVAELSAAPTLNSSVSDKITALYQFFFNKRTATTSVETLYKDDSSTALGTSTLANDGTTASKAKIT